METFTLFVILPSEEVCSLRHLPTGITVREVRCKLEMLAGLPSQIYRLVGTDEKIFHEEQDLVKGQNVWDGFLLHVVLLDSWQPVYDAVVQDNISWLLEHGAVHVKDQQGDDHGDKKDDNHDKDEQNTRRVVEQRGTVALFLGCWYGKDKLCRALLDVGVDPNGRTPFRRSPIFACVAQDNDRVLETLMTRGARASVKDYFGDTAMDVAKRNFARQCVNRMRSLQLMHRSRSPPHSPRFGSPTSSVTESVQSDGIQQRLGSGWKSPRVKSARVKSARISVTENAALIGHARASDKKPKGTGETHSLFNNRSHPIQIPPRVMPFFPQNSPRHSSISSSSPRVGSDAMEKTGSRTPRTSSGVQFRLAIPRTNSPNKTKHFVTWDYPLDNADILSVNVTKSTPPTSQRLETQNTWVSEDRSGSPRLSSVTEVGTSKESYSINTALSSPRPSASGDGQDISTDARSVESAPQINVPGDVARETFLHPYHGTLASARSRSRQLWKTSQKKSETVKTAKRRIQLSEQLKLDAKKRETFDQWLRRKRMQERADQYRHSTDGSSSEDDRESNSEAFKDWLKEVRERPLNKPNPNSAVSLHHRKTRALQGLIEIGDTSPPSDKQVVVEADVSSYMHSYKDWLKKRKDARLPEKEPGLDADSAKKALETKRLELLAMAVSFDEWMAHTEERKKLTKVILEADKDQLEAIARRKTTNPNGQPISFHQWKQQVEAKEVRQKMKSLRIRQQQDLAKQSRESQRNSASVLHEEWVRKKVQQQQLQQQPKNDKQQQQQQQQQQVRAKSALVRSVSPERSFGSWVNKKQQQEMNRLDNGIRKERQLLFQLREKKQVTISTC